MKKPIPFFSLKRQWDKISDYFTPELQKLLQKNLFVGGPYVSTFEQEFSTYIGAQHAISCNSGTDALWLALKALEVEPNTIVLTTPLSFIASSSEIVAHRANPVFIDVDESYNISSKKIDSWLKLNCKKWIKSTCRKNGRTIHIETGLPVSGIITVDLFGQCADYEKIKATAKAWGLWIIEDACQAVGAHINGKKAGTFGDISCFSLYPTKNLGVFGDGGVMTTDDPHLAEKLFRLRNHGRKNHYEYEHYGINSRLDAIQALAATKKLSILNQLTERRREIARIYNERLSQLPFIKLPKETIGYHVYHQYCIEVIDEHGRSCRDELKTHLAEHKIGTNIFYPKTLSSINFLKPPKELEENCPLAEKVTKTILALPIWPELTDEEVNHICTVLIEAVPQKKLFTFEDELCKKKACW